MATYRDRFGPPAGKGVPVTVLPDSLVARAPQQTAADTSGILRAMGYQQNTIDSLVVGPGTPPSMADTATSVMPLPEESLAVGEETWKIVKQKRDEGVPLDGQQIEQISRNIAKMAGSRIEGGIDKSIRGMAEFRSTWNKVHEAVADRVTQAATGIVADITPGFATLDFSTYVMKKWKIDGLKFLGIKPGAQTKLPGGITLDWPGIRDDKVRAEAELRMLPKITLKTQTGEDKTFGTSMAAGWYLLSRRARAVGKYMTGAAMKSAPGVNPAGGAAVQQQALTESAYVRQQVGPLAASLGDYPLYMDIDEANMSPEDLQWRYQWIYDHGTTGSLAAFAMSFGNVAADMADPTMLVAAIPGQLMNAGRKAFALARPLRNVEILSGIAAKTERAEDASMSLRAATKFRQATEQSVMEASMKTGEFGKSNLEDAKRLVLAKRQEAVERARMADFEPPGPHEHILVWRTAKRNAETIPKDTAPIAAVSGTLSGEVEKSASRLAYDDALKRYTQLVTEHGGVIDESMVLPGDLHAGNTVLRTTKTHRLELYRHPTKPAYVVRVTGATPGSLKNEVVEIFRPSKYKKRAERLVGMRGAGFDPALRELPEAVAEDLHEARLRTLSQDYDAALDWSGDPGLLEERRIMGPDGAEEAGDVLNVLTHTGGQGLDDVAVHAPMPEYNSSSPATGLSHVNLRQARATEALTVTEQEAVRTGALDLTQGEKMGIIPKQVLYRKRDILRRAYGAARNAKNDKAIALYRTKLAQNARAIKKLHANEQRGLVSLRDFEPDGWLPEARPGITHTPERYNNWLRIAGDRAVRSLYPNGLRLNNYWTTRVGQIHSLAREPMRFFRTYSPKTWDVVHGGYLEYQQGLDAWNQRMYQILEKAGVLRPVAKFNPKVMYAPFEVDAKRAEVLFDMLDTPEKTQGFGFAMEMAHDDMMARGDDALRGAHDEIRKTLNHVADLQGLSTGEGSPRELSGYINHLITNDQFADGGVPLEYIGVPGNAAAFVSHLKDRVGGATYSKDLLAALDIYGRGMNRKLHLEPVFEELMAVGTDLSAKHRNSAMQSYCTDLVNELKGKPHFLGAKIDNAIGAPIKMGRATWRPGSIDRTLMGISSAAYTAMIVGNPRYAVMQIGTGANTTISRFGLFRTLRGVAQFATPEGQAINKAMGTYKPFKDIFEDPRMKRVSQLLTDKGVVMTPLGPMSNGKAEEVIRGITAFAAIDLYLNKFGFSTWDEAVEAGMSPLIAMRALQSSQECNHLYGPLGRSPFMSRFTGRASNAFATQFLSFTWKQTDELLAQFAEDPSRIFTYLATAGFFSRVAAQGGINLTDYVGLGYLPNKTNDLTSPGVDAFMSLVDLSAALDSQDPDRVFDASKTMMRTVTSYIPLMNAMQTAGKTSERIAKGQLLTASGEYIRPMDFAETLSKQEGQSWLSTVAASVKPRGAQAPFGGELIPTVFGQKNIQEELTRRANDALRRENKIYAHNLRRFVTKFADTLAEGNIDKANEMAQELQDTYKIRFKSAKPVERELEARALSQQLRLITPGWGGDPDLFDRYIEILRNYGIDPEEIE